MAWNAVVVHEAHLNYVPLRSKRSGKPTYASLNSLEQVWIKKISNSLATN